MAVDIEKIKKMVDKISNLTVLELSKLVKALMDKFGLRTSGRVRHSATEVEEKEEVSEEPTEVEEASIKSEEESKPFPDPSSVEVPDDEPVDEPDDEPDDEPEGETYNLVYAWQYSGDNRYAKIGRSTRHLLHTRMRGTYHPKDTPELIGIWDCDNRKHAENVQNYILRKLKRTRHDREWVEIDPAFNKMINETFISDPNVLFEIFGTRVKIKKL